MKLLLKTPQKALNKAFLKQRPLRADMDLFKTNLITLLNKIDEIEREENQKNHVRDFLLNTYYKNTNEVNTKGTQDLVIHNGKDNKSSVGVIIEAKRPTNKNEWISVDKPNGKAFQELVLYYLRERIEENNIDIKYLIATNINEWYIFEASYFEKTFFQNKKFVKEYEEWRDGKKVTKDTKLFYNEIAKPYIDTLQTDVECTFFNIKDYEKVLKNESLEDDKSLIALLKILSPNHLLKVPFANDSNSLDKAFYGELLHLIGLTETKEGGKKLIQRQPEGSRNEGSLLENAIAQLESHDKILRLDTPSQYGNTHQERLFNVGLELVITWMNRILFLKLLEAQLLTYHKGDKKYAFLNLDKIKDYDELDKLFFSVLAKKVEERTPKINETFGLVPYLNSSLFEPTELEHQTLFINALDGNVTLPLYSSSVVNKDKKRKENLNGITYLFEFLNAYDFSSDGSGEIQEDNKKLINASVLGLIFEKINGYKDGSFFTPGFITMYMCRETIRRAVVQKFNEYSDLTGFQNLSGLNTIEDIYELIPSKIPRKQANEIVNSLKICDPAVGSGHFLVSALNEIIAIKSDLKILEDKDGKSLNRYEISVENDELVVTDEDGELYEYNPNNKESQRIQETLFHQKQTIIENCLFGVDINPNSVKICRLRLWVELLKNAYYKTNQTYKVSENLIGLNDTTRQLETLPNIDINIKCGNSLISRFGLDADIKKALKKSKWNVESYQLAVQTYRHAQSKEEKWEMERLIKDIKSDFRTEINKNDPKLGKLYKLNGELTSLTTQTGLFGMTPKEKKVFNKKVELLSNEIKKLETEIEEIKSNKIYENAFEWRFEFPEVLNNDGDFAGFDVVIGNPPYGATLNENDKKYMLNRYVFQDYQLDTYLLFVEMVFELMKQNAEFTFIIPNTWITNIKFKKIRKFIFENTFIHEIVHYNKAVFEEAVVDTETLFFKKINKPNSTVNIKVAQNINNSISNTSSQITWIESQGEPVNISINEKEQRIKSKLEKYPQLSEFVNIVVGLKPYQKGKGKPKQTEEDVKNRIFDSNTEISKDYFKLLRGSDINKYTINWKSEVWLKYGEHIAEPRYTANFFDDEKIVIRQTSDKLIATLDIDKFLCMNNLHVVTKLKDCKEINFKFLLGLINSKLLDFYYTLLNPEKGEALAEVKKENVSKLPINTENLKIKNDLSNIVDQILTIKKENPSADTLALEKEIDQLVYELYGLTEEEIKIVEGV